MTEGTSLSVTSKGVVGRDARLKSVSSAGKYEMQHYERGVQVEQNYTAAYGTGSSIDSGDLEIRILPNGERRYAILYDLKAPVTYQPTDCPPNSLQAFDSEIAAYMHTRRPGQSDPAALRTAPTDFHLNEEDVTDVQPAGPEQTTTASWDLTPVE